MQSGKKRKRERCDRRIMCEGIRKVKRSGNLKRGREKEKERESLELLPPRKGDTKRSVPRFIVLLRSL